MAVHVLSAKAAFYRTLDSLLFLFSPSGRLSKHEGGITIDSDVFGILLGPRQQNITTGIRHGYSEQGGVNYFDS